MSNLQIWVWGLLSVMLLLAVQASWENPPEWRKPRQTKAGIFHRQATMLCYGLFVSCMWLVIYLCRFLAWVGFPYRLRCLVFIPLPGIVRRVGAAEYLRRHP